MGSRSVPLGSTRLPLVPICALVCAIAFLAHLPALRQNLALALLNTAVTVTYAAIGLMLLRDPAHRRTGVLLALAGVFWGLDWANEWNWGPWPFLAEVPGPLALMFGAWGLLRYPDRALDRRGRAFIAFTGAWLCGGELVIALISRPQWHDFSPAAYWPALSPDHGAFTLLQTCYDVGGVVIALLFALLLYRKVGRLRGLDRQVMLPVTAATFAVAIVEVVTGIMSIGPYATLPEAVIDDLNSAALLTVPVAFLVGMLRRLRLGGALSDLAAELEPPFTAEGLRDVLRRTLRDPTLEILYWSADAGGYVDAVGRPAAVPAAGGDRLVRPVATRGGEPLAVVVAAHVRERRTVDAVLSLSRMALETSQLQADLKASRIRLLQSSQEVRRRIERNLHDGAQQRLAAMGYTLATLADSLPPGEPAELVGAARAELRAAQAELSRLARGVHPEVLTRAGLGPAVEGVAARLPLDVGVHVRAGRFGADLEAAAYFVVTEALTNAVRHAGASRALVQVVDDGSQVSIHVSDNGRGGADPTLGTGIAGMADRARAFGGDLQVESLAGHGTTVRATLPLA